jgi:serine-threonine kinase receptor-associated protein
MADLPSPSPVDAASASEPRTSPLSAGGVRTVEQGPIICPGHSRPVPDLAFTRDTPDGVFLSSSCLDNKAMLRDGNTGDWIGTFMGHKGAVWCTRLNTPATQAATAAADFSAKLWDALTGAELHTLQHKHIVKSLAFSADGSRLYTGGQEKKLRIFDLGRIDADAAILEDHKANITGVWTVADENLIVTAGAEKDIRFWDRRTNSVARRLATNGEVKYCQTTLDGSVLSVSTAGKEVSFYRTDDMSLIKTFVMPREVDCLSYDAVHQRFVTGSSTELWVRCYDFNSGDELACNKGHHGPVRSLAFTPSYNNYASGSEDGTIRIWSSGMIDEAVANKSGPPKDPTERANEKK